MIGGINSGYGKRKNHRMLPARGTRATEGRGTPHRHLSDAWAPSMSGAAPDVARAPAHRFGRAEDAGQGGLGSGSPGRTRMLKEGGG
jgi:hypothetical protein